MMSCYTSLSNLCCTFGRRLTWSRNSVDDCDVLNNIGVCGGGGGGTDEVRGQKVDQVINLQSHSSLSNLRCTFWLLYYIVLRTYRLLYYFIIFMLCTYRLLYDITYVTYV